MSQEQNSSDIKVATLEHFSDLQKPWGLAVSEGEPESPAVTPLHKIIRHVESVLKNPFGASQDSPLAKAYPVVIALLVSGGVLMGLFNMSEGGNVQVLQQRLLGQVQLSTGTQWARSVDDLNQLSWENGLEIMEALDNLNATLNRVETMAMAGKASTSNYARSQSALRKEMRQVNLLLKDREQLESVQSLLHVKQLYSPVFQEYLSETRDKYDTLTHPKAEEQQAAME